MLLSRKTLQRILGTLWLIDGLLQLQPQMFTMNMINGVMKPMLQNQPSLIESNLQWIIQLTTQRLIIVNSLTGAIQILLGLALLLSSGQWLKLIIIATLVWAFIVWYAGEGMSMLLTGQASALTGAPGAVLLYLLLGLAIYPRPSSNQDSLLSRSALRYILAAFWFFAALLQLQPYWWNSGQISQAISAIVGQGGLNTIIVDPVLSWLSSAITNTEALVNIAFIIVSVLIGLGLALVKKAQLRPFLTASLIASLILWYVAQALGMILTGMATDFNSGLILALIALACWPKTHTYRAARERYAHDLEQTKKQTSAQPV